MVQAYQAVPVSVEYEDVDNGRLTEHEGSALLGNRTSAVGLAKSEVQKEGHATLTSSVGNLANTIIGSGACTTHFPPFYRILRSVAMISRHAHLSSGTFPPTSLGVSRARN